MRSFIGVDLAWNVNAKHTGIVVLAGSIEGVELQAVSADVTSAKQVVKFILDHARAATVVAVDASLVVTNNEGQRVCESEIGRRFGAYGASCHSTNRNRMYWDTGPNLVKKLLAQGFAHDFNLRSARGRMGKWLFEVYPHPAMVQLFKLDRVISYKKGPVAERRMGLQILQKHLLSLCGRAGALRKTPQLESLLSEDVARLKGEGLKRYEDTLDALFCAYLAWHCWRWGEEKNEMFGVLSDGYIVVPKGHVRARAGGA